MSISFLFSSLKYSQSVSDGCARIKLVISSSLICAFFSASGISSFSCWNDAITGHTPNGLSAGYTLIIGLVTTGFGWTGRGGAEGFETGSVGGVSPSGKGTVVILDVVEFISIVCGLTLGGALLTFMSSEGLASSSLVST